MLKSTRKNHTGFWPSVVQAASLPANASLIAMQAQGTDASRLLKTLGSAHGLRVLCLLSEREMSVG